MKNKLWIILLLLSSLLINSCNDCPVENVDPITLCQTRIITIEQFNSNFTIVTDPNTGQEQVILDPDYNIGMFEFPINAASSGNFPNDSRFINKVQIPIVSLPFVFDNQIYYAAIVDRYPINVELSGDILVKDVDPIIPRATLRIYGSIDQIDQNYLNEDAQAFCNYVESNLPNIVQSFSNYTVGNKFGANQPGATVVRFDAATIVIIDQNGRIIGTLGAAGVPQPPANIINDLRAQAANRIAIDLPVVPGNVYTYIAKNGKRFVFFVSEIRQTNIPPNRKRVTIMFYPLDK